MSAIFVIEPGENLIARILTLLKAEGLDYSRNLVLFPGKRPAHFLRSKLAKHLGKSFIPPVVQSVDTFVDYVYRELLGRHSPDLQAIGAVAILHELHMGLTDRIGGTSFETLDAFVPLGLKMFGELEELKIAAVSERKVEESLTPLNRMYRPFYEAVDARGYTTRSLKYATVAEGFASIELDHFHTIIAAGFFALTHAEKSVFKRLISQENAVLIFQKAKGIEKHLRDLGIGDVLEKEPTSGPSVGATQVARIHYYKSPDVHGQVFGLADTVKRLLRDHEPLDERTAVVLPASEGLFPVVHQALALIPRDGYNISLGYPLTRTPVYGFLTSLTNVVSSMHANRFYAPDYVKFILHPYVKNILLGQRADVTRILLHTIEEHCAGTKSRTFFVLEELETETALFETVLRRVAGIDEGITDELLRSHLRSIHDETIRKLLNVQNVGDLARRCIDILTFIDGRSTARMHTLFRRYVESLIEVLDAVSASLLRDKKFQDPSGYFSFLHHCVTSVQVPFEGAPVRGLQVLGFLETRNLQFDRVFLLDANDDVIPGGGGQQTLIARKVRESLGLPTQQDHEEIAAYYFDLLLKGAKEVHLFFVENDKKVKSRFVERLLWEKQKAEGKEDASDYISTIRYDIDLAHTGPEPVSKTAEMIRGLRTFKYSATAVDTYLTCPLKFYYTYVMKLEEKEEVSGEVERSDLGSFIHKVLSTLYADTIGKPLKHEIMRPERVDSVVDELFAGFFGEEQTGGKYLIQKQVKSQLRRFLSEYQLPIVDRENIVVLGLEQKIEVEKGSFLFKGYIDRVEKRGDKIHVLDYKIGSDENSLKIDFDALSLADRSGWPRAIGSLQLPFYMLLYSERYGKAVDGIVPAYLFLGKNQVDEKIEVPLFEGAENHATQYELLEQILFGILGEIIDLSRPFEATTDFTANCPSCPFARICGTQWVRGYSW